MFHDFTYFINPLLFSNIQLYLWVFLSIVTKLLSIVSLVRGSEGLYMVNGPPHFTESTVLPRYSSVKWQIRNIQCTLKGFCWYFLKCWSFSVCGYFPYVCVCATLVCVMPWNQRRVLYSLELEVQVVVSCQGLVEKQWMLLIVEPSLSSLTKKENNR